MRTALVAALGLALQTVSPEVAEHARAGLAAKQAGNMNTAITEFRKVTELAPSLAAGYVNLGAALLETHAYGEAIPPLKKALQIDAHLPGAQRMLGYALLAQGYASEAIPYLEETKTLDALGLAQLKAGKLPEAIQTLQAALAERPNDPDLLYYLGRASGLFSKNTFDTLQAGYPDSASAHLSLGESYAALRRTAEAEKEFREALKARPDAPGVHLQLGRLYITAADWPKAAEQFAAESKLQPGDAEAAYNLGQALLEEGKLKEAQTELERANQLRPDMPETLYLLGKTAFSLNETARAETMWKRVLTIEDNTALAKQTHFALAGLYRKQGKAQQAAGEMQAFRKSSGPAR